MPSPPTIIDCLASKRVLSFPPAISESSEDRFTLAVGLPLDRKILLDTGTPVIKFCLPPMMVDPKERLSIVFLSPPTIAENFIIVLPLISVPCISTGPRIVF